MVLALSRGFYKVCTPHKDLAADSLWQSLPVLSRNCCDSTVALVLGLSSLPNLEHSFAFEAKGFGFPTHPSFALEERLTPDVAWC